MRKRVSSGAGVRRRDFTVWEYRTVVSDPKQPRKPEEIGWRYSVLGEKKQKLRKRRKRMGRKDGETEGEGPIDENIKSGISVWSSVFQI